MRSANTQGLFGTRTLGQGMSARTGTTSGLGLSSAFSAALNSWTSTRQGTLGQAGRQPGQFVGADTSDVRNLLGFVTNPNQATQAWRQGLTALRGATGVQPNQRTGRFTGNVGGRGTSATGEVPAYLAPGFTYSPPEPGSVAATLQTPVRESRIDRSRTKHSGQCGRWRCGSPGRSGDSKPTLSRREPRPTGTRYSRSSERDCGYGPKFVTPEYAVRAASRVPCYKD